MAPVLWVHGSRNALLKVLTNLVENARQAMGEAGKVPAGRLWAAAAHAASLITGGAPLPVNGEVGVWSGAPPARLSALPSS